MNHSCHHRIHRQLSVFVVAAAMFVGAASSPAVEPETDVGLPNVEVPTFGGLQYWADELVFHGFRIQRNASTGHYRLLNSAEQRLAWGTFEQCRARLDEIKRTEHYKPLPKRVVLTLHGMARSRHSMSAVATCVGEHSKTPVFQIGYCSTCESIPKLAASFDRLMRHLDGVEEVDIVAYSMGNIVVRHWLGDVAADDAERAAVGMPPIVRPRLRRYVMLGPPNNGAQRANLWAENPVGRELFRFVMGDAGEQLGPRFTEIKDRLAVPDCEFGIIAGGKGDDIGWHDGITGDDDGTVGVAETKVAGAADFAVVPVRHTWLVTDRRVLDMTCTFLEHGYFEAAAKRNMLPK